MIGEQIGVAVENSMIYEKLVNQKTELENTLDELQKTQNYLIEAKKMASLGNLVAGVAHEMNTPISNAINATHILIEKSSKINNINDYSHKTADDLKEFIETNDELSKILLSNLQKVRELIQSFKSTAVSNNQETTAVIKIKQFLRDLYKSISPTIKNKNIKFEIDHNSEFIVNTKPNSLFQIFTNLIMNSYIHGFENKKAGMIRIDFKKNEKNLEFSYKDDGVGIAPEISARIFEPFFSTKKSTCTGIGLHIIYNTVVNKLRGQIDFESKKGKGTLFIISIPLN
jgi:signal transduction histidine kinase